MAHRRKPKRKDISRTPVRPGMLVRFLEEARAFLKESMRIILFFAGVAMLAQAFIPWTNNRIDVLYFIVVGSVMLGVSIPKRLWL